MLHAHQIIVSQDFIKVLWEGHDKFIVHPRTAELWTRFVGPCLDDFFGDGDWLIEQDFSARTLTLTRRD